MKSPFCVTSGREKQSFERDLKRLSMSRAVRRLADEHDAKPVLIL
jgi:hypothetical protein